MSNHRDPQKATSRAKHIIRRIDR